MRIKLATPLIGEFPRYANVKIPDNAAVTAQNRKFLAGRVLAKSYVGMTLKVYADNPVAYAYALVQASGEFIDAEWNV